MNVTRRTPFALFHAYRFGTRSRTGPPCSRGNGWPSHRYTRATSPSYRTESGCEVVYPSPQWKFANLAVFRIFARSARSLMDTPTHALSKVDQPVTQWNAEVNVLEGSFWSSSYVNRSGLSTEPSTRRSHSFG